MSIHDIAPRPKVGTSAITSGSTAQCTAHSNEPTMPTRSPVDASRSA